MGEPYDFGLSAKANTARTASCSDELKFILLFVIIIMLKLLIFLVFYV